MLIFAHRKLSPHPYLSLETRKIHTLQSARRTLIPAAYTHTYTNLRVEFENRTKHIPHPTAGRHDADAYDLAQYNHTLAATANDRAPSLSERNRGVRFSTSRKIAHHKWKSRLATVGARFNLDHSKLSVRPANAIFFAKITNLRRSVGFNI